MTAFCAAHVDADEPRESPNHRGQSAHDQALDQTGSSSVALRDAAVKRLPMQRLTRTAQKRILDIAQSPTIYRQLPTQAIDCDQDMFLFLTRNPEVLVGMWDLMGITNVQCKRTGPYQLDASDGSGTTCRIDLVYGDPTTHIYIANGSYDGKLVARPIRGSGVFVVTSNYAHGPDGSTQVTGKIDCFLQLDSLGADLIARTFSGLIGRSADKNFVETARFMTQVSQASQRNPNAMLDVADRIPQVNDHTRREFAGVIEEAAIRARERVAVLLKRR
ncbi:hypothetical protein [Rubripirellula obstinata]|uniref:hypothetical protein n=1 Tax=Rubripirellula obstinata TaxID=406547 RepID=UPI00122CE207|nr:hypothetical protein [Rubripirellula obstinata]